MNIINKISFSLLGLLILISCNRFVDESIIIEKQTCDRNDLLISDFQGTLDVNSAINVAKLHAMKNMGSATRNSIEKRVKNIMPVVNNEGLPILYAINFEEGGFTLVSASKKYYPIVGESENGLFDDEIYKTGISILLEEYKQDIAKCAALPKDSTVLFRALWGQYIKRPEIESQAIKTVQTRDGLLSILSDSQAEWAENGFNYQSLSEGCPDGLPSSTYNDFCLTAQSLMNTEYADDYMDLSFILSPDPDYYYQKGPLVTSCWNQWYPYNTYTPTNQYGNHYPLCCLTVALGQIMRFHEWPQSYSWSSMPNSGYSTVTAQFLKDVGEAINTDYTDSSSSLADVISALDEEYDYHYDAYYYHDLTRLFNSVAHDRPVIMSGLDSSGEGHAWICDGFRRYRNANSVFILMILSTSSPMVFETAGQYGSETNTFKQHINWGYSDTSYSGWFVDYYCHGFSSTRRNLYNIYPNE